MPRGRQKVVYDLNSPRGKWRYVPGAWERLADYAAVRRQRDGSWVAYTFQTTALQVRTKHPPHHLFVPRFETAKEAMRRHLSHRCSMTPDRTTQGDDGGCTCDEPTWTEPFVGSCTYCEDRPYWEALAEATFPETCTHESETDNASRH